MGDWKLKTKLTMDATLPVFDEQGALLGTIHRPRSPDPVGPGRETVYLVRAADSREEAAAA
jgi:hypothetical protein